MRTAVVIPARLASTRLPQKPLSDLAGFPLVVQTARQAMKAHVGPVIVATDADEIARMATSHGLEVQMTSAAHPSGTDRVAEVCERLELDAVINLQGDEPFVHPADLRALAAALHAGASMVTLRCPTDALRDPNVVKVVTRQDGRALYFSRAPIPFARDGGTAPAHRHLGVYGYTSGTLRALRAAPEAELERVEKLEQLRALAMGLDILVLDAQSEGMGIDTLEELERARARVAQLGTRAFPSLEDITEVASW